MDKTVTARRCAQAAADDTALRDVLRAAVRRWRDALAAGRGVVHVPPVERPFRQAAFGHFHTYPEVFLQLCGEGDMLLVGGRCRYRPGEAVVVPRGVVHHEAPDPRTGPFWNLVLVCVDGHVAFHIAEDARVRRRGGVATRAGTRLRGWLNEAVAAMGEGRPPGHPLVRALLAAHAALLDEVLHGDDRAASPDALVEQAQRLITQYLGDQRLSVGWLAAQLRCSPDRLARRFRVATGRAPVRAITEARIALARALLREPGLTVAEVARACGCGDPAYFSRIFAAAEGHPPRVWRSLHPP